VTDADAKHPSKSEAVPSFYSNIVQVTRTPWDVNLHFHRVIGPADVESGTRFEVAQLLERIAVVTLPLEVAKSLVKILDTIASAEPSEEIQPEQQPAKEEA